MWEASPSGANMGIVPISSFIPVTVTRSNQTDLEPLPMERAENSSRAGDETYSPSEKSDDSEEESGEDEGIEVASDETTDDPAPQIVAPEIVAPGGERQESGGVNLFA
jgi:hypothetical protein